MPESTHSHRAAVQGSGKVPAFSTAAVSAASVAGETTAGQLAGGRRYEVVSCHHNYVTWERHYGENVLITRKGAVRAREGDMGIIPGSMGARSYIVRGKGNPESFMSCSHGAGRAMSRAERSAASRSTITPRQLPASSAVRMRTSSTRRRWRTSPLTR